MGKAFLLSVDAAAASRPPPAPSRRYDARSTRSTGSGRERGSATEGGTESGVAEERRRVAGGGRNTRVGDDQTRCATGRLRDYDLVFSFFSGSDYVFIVFFFFLLRFAFVLFLFAFSFL